MTSPLLEIRHIYKSFPGRRRDMRVQALRGVSLSIGRGETLAIVGESGCGKTTLGQLIALISAPDRGQVFFGGVNVAKQTRLERKALRRKVQMVLQDSGAAFNPFWRVESALHAPLKLSQHANPSQRIREVLELVGLPCHLLTQFPQDLSGGQRQRLNIARALMISPDLLVADEPTSALDVSVQARIIRLLTDLHEQRGLTMVVITHNLATVPYLARNVVIMYFGRIVERGASDDVLFAPRHPYTRLLIDSLPGRSKRSVAPNVDEIPSPVRLPPGCAFHPRCMRAREPCRQILPELSEAGEGGHLVACHFPLSG